MTSGVGAESRVFALLGDPVRHSLSPAIQNEAIREAGVDAVYVALRTGAEDLAGLVRGLARGGGGGNVTIPHKAAAAALVDERTEAVKRTGACNTFWAREGVIVGDNTDVAGFGRSVQALLDGSPDGARVLLVGAGGAARAAVVSLQDDGVGEVHVVSRTLARTRALASRIGDSRIRVAEGWDDVEPGPYDLVVNATPLGMSPGDPLPVELEWLSGVGAVLDLVYGPSETPLVRRAKELGLRAADGGEMLVAQGAASFQRWWDRDAPLEVMRRALDSARVR